MNSLDYLALAYALATADYLAVSRILFDYLILFVYRKLSEVV